ncbi:hypothetical protein Adt_05749 [Abeliophyllum distichum]|uniref:Uncharacterized protein n=1 Tax=Abeliophyllum distichum TaxID=126358 RepID=A0ABD1V749_9LAMI
MMRQQQGIAHPKMPKLLKVENKKEDRMGEPMEELPENSSGKSKFERNKNDENEEDPGRFITIQFVTLPTVMANNYLLANEFKSKENKEEERKDNEEEACMLECGEGIGQTSQNACEEEKDDGVREVDLLGEPSRHSFDYYVLYGTHKRKVRVPRSEKYGSPPRILPSPMGWVIEEEAQEKSKKEVQNAEDQCEILHVNLSQD